MPDLIVSCSCGAIVASGALFSHFRPALHFGPHLICTDSKFSCSASGKVPSWHVVATSGSVPALYYSYNVISVLS